jgi:hypothetical protein
MRGIHPPGGMPVISALARMMNDGVAAVMPELNFCVSLFCDKVLFTVYHPTLAIQDCNVKWDHFNVLK